MDKEAAIKDLGDIWKFVHFTEPHNELGYSRAEIEDKITHLISLLKQETPSGHPHS